MNAYSLKIKCNGFIYSYDLDKVFSFHSLYFGDENKINCKVSFLNNVDQWIRDNNITIVQITDAKFIGMNYSFEVIFANNDDLTLFKLAFNDMIGHHYE